MNGKDRGRRTGRSVSDRDRSGESANGIGRFLAALDPESVVPGYWDGLLATVMERASRELAGRRRLTRDSIARILSGWSRSLIPAAVAAAAIAAFLVAGEGRQGVGSPAPLLLEDMLLNEVGDGAFRAVLSGRAPASPVTFMAVVEGNGPQQ